MCVCNVCVWKWLWCVNVHSIRSSITPLKRLPILVISVFEISIFPDLPHVIKFFFFSSNSRECNWFKSCFDLIAPLKNRPNLFENGNYKMKKSGEILRDTHFWWFPGFWLILSRTNRFGCGLWVRVVSVDCGCLWWLWVIGWGLIWLNGVASSWVAVSGFGWFTISFEILWQPKQKLSAWYQWENRGAENS